MKSCSWMCVFSSRDNWWGTVELVTRANKGGQELKKEYSETGSIHLFPSITLSLSLSPSQRLLLCCFDRKGLLGLGLRKGEDASARECREGEREGIHYARKLKIIKVQWTKPTSKHKYTNDSFSNTKRMARLTVCQDNTDRPYLLDPVHSWIASDDQLIFMVRSPHDTVNPFIGSIGYPHTTFSQEYIGYFF